MRRLLVAFASCLALLVPPRAAHADDKQRITLLEENDSLYFNTDKHYTQGVNFAYLGPDILPASGWNAPFDFLAAVPTVFQKGAVSRARRFSLEFGQSIFTPKDASLRPPDPRDRPYAGWLYLGASLLQETDRRSLENFELQLGVVGPAALGKQVQNNYHQLIGKEEAQGWSSQLQNEPGINISYDRMWRVPVVGNGRSGVDVVPELGATIGNVFIYGEVGGLLRIGRNLQAEYGPNRIRPALSGTN